MPERKSYGQFCALARALDHVGDRWTLLVVRELLLGPKTFRQLQDALVGMGPTLLSERIRALLADGLIDRNDAPARSKFVSYTLTEAGRALEPAVFELIRWGARWMRSGPGPDRVDPAWAALAVRALLDGTASNAEGVVHVDVEGTWLTVSGAGGERRVALDRHGRPDAVVSARLPVVLAAASGLQRLSRKTAEVSGPARLAASLLSG